MDARPRYHSVMGLQGVSCKISVDFVGKAIQMSFMIAKNERATAMLILRYYLFYVFHLYKKNNTEKNVKFNVIVE